MFVIIKLNFLIKNKFYFLAEKENERNSGNAKVKCC